MRQGDIFSGGGQGRQAWISESEAWVNRPQTHHTTGPTGSSLVTPLTKKNLLPHEFAMQSKFCQLGAEFKATCATPFLVCTPVGTALSSRAPLLDPPELSGSQLQQNTNNLEILQPKTKESCGRCKTKNWSKMRRCDSSPEISLSVATFSQCQQTEGRKMALDSIFYAVPRCPAAITSRTPWGCMVQFFFLVFILSSKFTLFSYKHTQS